MSGVVSGEGTGEECVEVVEEASRSDEGEEEDEAEARESKDEEVEAVGDVDKVEGGGAGYEKNDIVSVGSYREELLRGEGAEAQEIRKRRVDRLVPRPNPARTALRAAFVHRMPEAGNAIVRGGGGRPAEVECCSTKSDRPPYLRRSRRSVAGGGPHGRRRAQTEFDARAARREAHLAARGRGSRRARRGASDDGDGDDELMVRGKRREGAPDRQPQSAQSLSKRPRGRRERRVTGSESARPKVRQL